MRKRGSCKQRLELELETTWSFGKKKKKKTCTQPRHWKLFRSACIKIDNAIGTEIGTHSDKHGRASHLTCMNFVIAVSIIKDTRKNGSQKWHPCTKYQATLHKIKAAKFPHNTIVYHNCVPNSMSPQCHITNPSIVVLSTHQGNEDHVVGTTGRVENRTGPW